MSSRTYSSMDPNATGPGLILQQGNAVVTTAQPGLDFDRVVHGTIPKAVGQAYFECYVYTQSKTSLQDRVRVGIADMQDDLDRQLGRGANAYAYDPFEGAIYNNGSAIVSSLPTTGERQCIGILLLIDSGGTPSQVTFFVNGSPIADPVPVTFGIFFVPAVTVCGGDAGDISAYLNFGAGRAFDFPPITVF